RPPERRERPEPRREPGIEHVGVLSHGAAAVGAGRQILARDVHATVALAVPGRNPMAPPELAGDAPRPDGLHPVVVRLRPTSRDDLDAALADGLGRLGGQWLHVHVPLLGDQGLDDGLAAIAESDRVAIWLDAVDEPERLHVFDDAPARLEAIETRVLSRVGRHLAVEADDGLDRQGVAFSGFEGPRVLTGR